MNSPLRLGHLSHVPDPSRTLIRNSFGAPRGAFGQSQTASSGYVVVLDDREEDGGQAIAAM